MWRLQGYRAILLTSWLVVVGCAGPNNANSDGTAGTGGTGGSDGGDGMGGLCGNGRLDPGERCDPAIATGQTGACPTNCNDNDFCTVDGMTGRRDDCSLRCTHEAITACGPQDNCCAPGCSAATDPDCSPSCGNGVVEPGEQCDKAIPAGQPGACPSNCDDGNPCTMQALVGSVENCTARCMYRDITACGPDDGCCPSGCNATNDPNCTARCGNGVVEMGETCDPPASCPASCDDANACTRDSLQGSAASCTARCLHDPITVCGPNDGCCPSNCNANNDPNCMPRCGNGVIEAGESCDPPSSCPTSCDDGNACTADTLFGSAANCTASCGHQVITSCGPNDGCCPAGCGAGQDPNCSTAVCGNGFVEMGELCDTAIPAGQAGHCPQSVAECNDGNACTVDGLAGSGCQRACTHTQITSCVGGDGCCPSGCNANNDSDCMPRCGNGVVEVGETCDPPSSCPTLAQCNDGNACTTDLLVGSAQACTAQCAHSAITQCSFTSDGCCPSGCNANNDINCNPVCGNGVLEGSERCDTGIPAGASGACPTSCPSSCFDFNDCPLEDDCVNGRCVPLGGGDTTCRSETLTGTACNARCVVNPAVTSCGGGADMCCPFSCNQSSDTDCFSAWSAMTLQANVAFSTTCTNLLVTLQAGHHYVVTTCVATGTALAGSGDTIVEVHAPGTDALVVQDDDCTTTPNLISLAGWSCTNGNGSRFASCAGETPGGFNAPVSGSYRICLRAFSSTSTGTATVTLWSN